MNRRGFFARTVGLLVAAVYTPKAVSLLGGKTTHFIGQHTVVGVATRAIPAGQYGFVSTGQIVAEAWENAIARKPSSYGIQGLIWPKQDLNG
jgi:hypothetical protein